ncbi:MAG: VOC family protein [Spirochaetaceae bacterium]
MFKIHHICIQTNNYRESLNFYTEVLGFKIIEETTNFHGREYNTWLELNSFKIELQTGKGSLILDVMKKESEGIVHFCLFSSEFIKDYKNLKKNELTIFIKKNGSDIYDVNGKQLFKIAAPEGTIVEVRDTLEL